MASGDTKTEAMLNVLGNGGTGDEFRGCCNTKTQGYILDAIDRINNLTPGGGPTVVQTTGTSTTDVMSQNAVTGMVFADPSTKYNVQIGSSAAGSSPNHSIAIGNSTVTSTESITIGENAYTAGQNQIAIGRGAIVNNSNARGCISLGDQTITNGSEHGVMNIGPASTSYGYNSTNYRLLTGVHDPVNAHDAATKGYVDASAGSIIYLAYYPGAEPDPSNIRIYADAALTTELTGGDFYDILSSGKNVTLRFQDSTEREMHIFNLLSSALPLDKTSQGFDHLAPEARFSGSTIYTPAMNIMFTSSNPDAVSFSITMETA